MATKRKTATKPGTAKKSVPKRAARPISAKRAAKTAVSLDLSSFTSELVTRVDRHVCLACVLHLMTRHLGLSAKTAQAEVKRYAPSLEELRSRLVSRPFFVRENDGDPCPYCGSAAKWHARLTIHRIESGKATDIQRRALLKSLQKNQFAIVEERATQQGAFFEWMEKTSAGVNLEGPRWIAEVSRSYLARKEPKTRWDAEFAQVRSIRRSRLLENGWELEHGRLFLAPLLFDELLFVQYLASRAHHAGGLTLEGRYTLPELMTRLRNSGYLRAAGITTRNPSDAFEQLLTHLGGGDHSLRFYHVVDRRDLLERVQALKDLRVPIATVQNRRTHRETR